MKNKLIAGLVLIFTSAGLIAQEPKKLTLKEAVALALAYNKTLQSDKVKVEAAAAAVKEAYERRLPDASISGSYLYLPVQPNIHMKNGNDSGSAGPKVNQVVYGMASVSFPLYSGGRIKYGIESAKYLEQAMQLDAEHDRMQVVLNTVNACINLYKAYTAIELVQENLQQAQQRVKDFTNMEKNGLLARNDLMKAELQASTVELTLLDAQTNYKLASVNMNLMMGLPEQTALVPDKSGLALPDSIKDFDTYEQEALAGRKDVTALTYREKVADVDVKTAKSAYYPTLGLTAGYVAADIPGLLTVTNAVNIGVGIKYDLASLWKTKTRIQQAKLKVQEIKLSEGMLADNIRLDVNRAYQNYLVSRKKIDVYEKSVAQAEENYRITKNKYDNSLASTQELLDADVALLQSKLNVTNAKADSFLAYNKLLQVTGALAY